MNVKCAHCTNDIGRHRWQEILCESCEQLWQAKYYAVYQQWVELLNLKQIRGDVEPDLS